MGVLEIFDGYSGSIVKMSLRFYISVLEIFDGCPGNISGNAGDI